MAYDYESAVREDVAEYLHEVRAGNIPAPTDRDDLYDHLFTEDDVTGNGSGSYWCNSAKARECVCGDPLADQYAYDLVSEFGLDSKEIAEHLFDWEYWDVSIRCYLLSQVLDDVLDELAWEF